MEKMDKIQYQKEHKLHTFRKLKNKLLNLCVRFTVIPSIRIFFYRCMGIKIGKNVFIGMDCYLDDEVPNLITIEDDVTIAFRVTLVAHDDVSSQVSQIKIRKGSFIGTGTIITMGVEVGQNAVVGAGAVVKQSVDEGITVVGVPAKPIQ